MSLRDDDLERALLKAALDLVGATSAHAFSMPVPNTSPQLYLSMHEGPVQLMAEGLPAARAVPADDRPQECAASGAGHSDGTHGPNGETQCAYCGQAPAPGVQVVGGAERRAATCAEVLSDVDPVVLEAWKLQGCKVGAMLREAQVAVIELTEELGDSKDAAAAKLEAAPLATSAPPPVEAREPTDTQMLDFIASEYLDVLAFPMPTPGGDDADVGWKLLQHHQGEVKPREVALHWRDDLREAIREAMRNLHWIKRTRRPRCPGPLGCDHGRDLSLTHCAHCGNLSPCGETATAAGVKAYTRPQVRGNMTTPRNEGTVPAAVPADSEEQSAIRDASRYRKLRGWMSSNVKEGWQEVENMGALCAWESWDAMDFYLDALPDCGVGLMSRPEAAGATSAPPPVEAREPKKGWEFNDGWQFFVCYLIDRCEGAVVTEEMLHRMAADFLRDPKYGAATHPKEPTEAREASAEAFIQFDHELQQWDMHTLYPRNPHARQRPVFFGKPIPSKAELRDVVVASALSVKGTQE